MSKVSVLFRRDPFTGPSWSDYGGGSVHDTSADYGAGNGYDTYPDFGGGFGYDMYSGNQFGSTDLQDPYTGTTERRAIYKSSFLHLPVLLLMVISV